MKNFRTSVLLLFLFSTIMAFAQGRPGGGNGVKVTGKVIEQDTKLPLEFATVTIQTPDNVTVNGAMTDAKGEYTVTVPPGTYNIKFDFISFKSTVISGKEITADANLGTMALEPDATLLKDVEITAERSTVDIKLDKRVYNIGNDMMVKGGSVSDVLDNVPSLSVDAEGNVALRGNQSVTILIDGRPSTLAGSNVADVLRLLPADSVDKVEVITNPSARYDAEGGGGIVNIILKKGSANGFNGSFVANTGTPANHGISTNLNYRSDHYNVFSSLGYNYRNSPGNAKTNTQYLDDNDNTTSFVNEHRTNDRLQRAFNGSFGIEWFLDKTLTWTNSISGRRSSGDNPTDTYFDNYDASHVYQNTRFRYNLEDDTDTNFRYSTNLVKKFDDKGHELKIDASVSKSIDDEDAVINDINLGNPDVVNSNERTSNNQNEDRGLIQADYVLPLGKDSRFEAGYRGSFTTLETDAKAEILEDGTWVNNGDYTNFLQYKEKVNALYSQFGSKIGSFSYLFGLRWEDSNIDVNLLNLNDYHNKHYNNFFPSAFFSYEFAQGNSVSLSYSRRINRPRGRFLNPFSGLQSNINVFRGNPELNPSYTNAFDIGYLRKWNQVTLSTSAYINITDDNFQVVRRNDGATPDGTPITISTPINLSKEYRFGFEFNVNYNPFKWWRINSNFNFYRYESKGDYTFVYQDENNQTVTDYQNFNRTAYSWTTRINSKITLPWKIDWQLNGQYDAPQNSAQGRRVGVASANTVLSKDILKDKATIALNVQDIFNSRKMKNDTYVPGELRSYSEMQWRQRQVTLSFTYRFNMTKSDRQKENQQKNQQDDGGDYMGG